MSRQSKVLKNQKGQLALEMVLLIAVIVGIATTVVQGLQQSEFVKRLVVSPWGRLSGMVECGVWSPCGAGDHPSSKNRNVSLDPRSL